VTVRSSSDTHVVSGPKSAHGILDSWEAGDGIETGHVYVNMH